MRRVLVIDDEQMIRDLIKQALERRNHCVETADNAKTGMAMFDQKDYDLVITDVNMPDLDGHSVVRHIRRNTPHKPVIGLSGTPWLLQNSGFDDVLAKPFPILSLIEKAETLTSVSVAV
ncbi:MAG: response regulator [Desulfatitalea sp.]|nr:response regulator [Desulfatitalea sp.]NNK00762.1 response regulator [Desulfatitalea sp.]